MAEHREQWHGSGKNCMICSPLALRIEQVVGGRRIARTLRAAALVEVQDSGDSMQEFHSGVTKISDLACVCGRNIKRT